MQCRLPGNTVSAEILRFESSDVAHRKRKPPPPISFTCPLVLGSQFLTELRAGKQNGLLRTAALQGNRLIGPKTFPYDSYYDSP